MDNNAVALAAISLAGALAAGFFALLNKLSKSIDANTNSNKAIVKEATLSRKVQERGFDEAKQRNGHLAELFIQQSDSIKASIDSVQHIDTQQVDHQVINDATVVGKPPR